MAIPYILGAGAAAVLAYLAATDSQHDDNTNMSQPNSFTAMSKARDYSQNNFLDKAEPHELLLNNPKQFNKDYYLLNRDAYMDNAMQGFYEWALKDPNYPYRPDIESFKNAGKFYRGVDYPDRNKHVHSVNRNDKTLLPFGLIPVATQPEPTSPPRIRLNIDSHNPKQTYKDMLALNAYINTIQQYGSEKQRKHVNTIINPSLFDFFGYPDLSVQNEIIDFFNQNKEALAKYDPEVYKRLLPEEDYSRFIEDESKRYKVLPTVPTEDSVKIDSVTNAGTQKTEGKPLSKPESKLVMTHGRSLLNSRINKDR